jgi:hypothetical protein
MPVDGEFWRSLAEAAGQLRLAVSCASRHTGTGGMGSRPCRAQLRPITQWFLGFAAQAGRVGSRSTAASACRIVQPARSCMYASQCCRTFVSRVEFQSGSSRPSSCPLPVALTSNFQERAGVPRAHTAVACGVTEKPHTAAKDASHEQNRQAWGACECSVAILCSVAPCARRRSRHLRNWRRTRPVSARNSHVPSSANLPASST